MDVDINAVKAPQMSRDERLQLMKEKRCFYCKDEGHQARECPKKKKRNETSKTKDKGKQPTCARTSQTEVVDDRDNEEKPEEDKDAPPAYDSLTTLVRRVKALKTEDREALMDQMASQDFV